MPLWQALPSGLGTLLSMAEPILLSKAKLCYSEFNSTGLSEPCCRGSAGLGQLAEEPSLPVICHAGHSALLCVSEAHAGHPDHWPKHDVIEQTNAVAIVQLSFSLGSASFGMKLSNPISAAHSLALSQSGLGRRDWSLRNPSWQTLLVSLGQDELEQRGFLS